MLLYIHGIYFFFKLHSRGLNARYPTTAINKAMTDLVQLEANLDVAICLPFAGAAAGRDLFDVFPADRTQSCVDSCNQFKNVTKYLLSFPTRYRYLGESLNKASSMASGTIDESLFEVIPVSALPIRFRNSW